MTATALHALAAAGAVLLVACTSSPTGPETTDGEPLLVADYTILGDRIITQSPPDTDWICTDTGKALEIGPGDADTNRFTLSGNTLRLFSVPDTIHGGAPDYLPEAVVDRYTELKRYGSGLGLEGRWRLGGYGEIVLSGALSAESMANFEDSRERFRRQSRYIAMEYEFSGGKVRAWLLGDFAGLFVARWNGELLYDSSETPDSAEYDIEVAKVDPATVRLKGRKTGETVTLTFAGPRKSRTYASDNPAHAAYTEYEAARPCNVEPWFNLHFLEDNRRADVGVLKPGAGGDPEAFPWLPHLPGPGIFPGP